MVISSYIGKSFLKYDFATASHLNFLIYEEILFSFLSVHFGHELTCLVPAGLTGQLYAAGGTGQKDPAAGFAHQVPVRTLRQSGARLQSCANQDQDYKKMRQSGKRWQSCANQELDFRKLRQSGARLQSCANQEQGYKKLRQPGVRWQSCANQEQGYIKKCLSGARLQKNAPIRSKITKLRASLE
jgi:hypothetical protein